ncbi:GNAT family N-acetyltransferase [uncultured Jannaschia sp.]|uniref:GNAT family N-acetyltransferase n=1 Tax=uncultured Jannaschia sp. TaxID=293347 RepID=UPI002608AF9E|nr:GNAT family N-acetyltransferase [uncultured Jannaschia sp.]
MASDRPRIGPVDPSALQGLYHAAFPDEDLAPLVTALASEPATIHLTRGTPIVAHAALTRCEIGDDTGYLLGPVAVAPDAQGQGHGRALIEAAIAEANGARVMVLGDPAFYTKFGFSEDRAVAPPYPLPAAWRAAWQGTGRPVAGVLTVPAPWRDPALWS